MGRIVAIIGLSLLILVMAYQDYRLYFEGHSAEQSLSALQEQYDVAAAKNTEIQNDIQYYSDDVNLLKEARSQLNYLLPGEKEIIVVPKK